MSNISFIIDAYATICAHIASLEKDKARLKKELQFLEVGTHEGEQYVLTITHPESKVKDEAFKAKIAAFIEGLSTQYTRAHTSTVKGVTFKTTKREYAEVET